MYSFGPGFELLEGELYLALNTYPTNINKIESSIAANDSSTKYNDKRGFPALDYLLFSESNANLITKFSDRKRISYLKAVSKHLKDLVSKVTNNWVGYESEFVTKTGLDIGSSTSIIYNQMLASFERTKNFSINLPLGKFVGSPTTNPEKLPGYYSGISTELILESIEATDRFWAGKTVNNIDGLGFDDYLEVSERGKGISNNTKSQIKIVKEKINLLPIGTTLKDVILSGNKTITDQIYSEVAKTTKFYKTELPSELGLSIVFGTGDGD